MTETQSGMIVILIPLCLMATVFFGVVLGVCLFVCEVVRKFLGKIFGD